MLEKCYAKAFSNLNKFKDSYSNIESGITGEAIRDLTGAPYSS